MVAALLVNLALAAPVTLEHAETAAGNWLARDAALGSRLGGGVASARTCSPDGGQPFHVVRFDGGGFAVFSSDTSLEPVIAFSESDDLVESNDNPLWALLGRDAKARAAALAEASGPHRAATRGAVDATRADWARASEEKWEELLSATPRAKQGVASVSDVRVAPLVQSKWNQGGVGSGYCYDYYTPSHYVCGCVATAGAQIMRYFQWPKTSMKQYTCKWCTVDGTVTKFTTRGGTYNWANMPLVPSSSMSDAQRQAIGKLTSDLGICCGMNYESDGSGTGDYMLVFALTRHFGYSNAIAYLDGDGIDADIAKRAIVSNLDAGLPVEVGVYGSSGGHSIVGDGYGYSNGTLYYHFNMGWGGTDNAWYAPPRLGTSSYPFSAIDGFVYNIYTNQPAGSVICSGRVLDSESRPVAGATVSAGASQQYSDVTDENGIYALVLPAGTHALTARSGSLSAGRSVTLSACVSLSICDDTRNWFGSYWSTPKPSVGNLCDQDIVLGAAPEVPPDDPVEENAWYVDADAGMGGDGTEAHPFLTINEAIDAACDAGVTSATIHVAPGTYRECVAAPDFPVLVIGDEGPDVTAIDGEGQSTCFYDPSADGDYESPDDYHPSTLAGFTLRNGVYDGMGGGAYGGVLYDCVIRDCHAMYGAGAYASELYSCVLMDNHAENFGGGAGYCYLEYCTVIDNSAGDSGAGIDGDCDAAYCIVWDNLLDDGATENWETYIYGDLQYASALYGCCTEPMPTYGSDNITDDPRLLGGASGDFREWFLRAGSPCLDAAPDSTNIGAYQDDGVAGFVVAAACVGLGSVDPEFAVVAAGGSASFTASGLRPFLRFETNGVFASSSPEFTWRDIRADGVITAVFDIVEFHVDAATGSDANDGLSWSTPKATIQGAVDDAIDGERVLVKPGTYGPVVIDDGREVEIVSTDGASATAIDGLGVARCFDDADGRSTLDGFTLSHGVSFGANGGGANGGTFVDCVFTGCAAKKGGAAANSKLVDCLVVDNYSTTHGGGTYRCELVNCTVTANESGSYGGGDYGSSAVNSIIAGNTASSSDDSSAGSYVKCFAYGDPLFADSAQGDYRLSGSSPCIDAGYTDLAPGATDLAGAPRVSGAAVDLGCYEYSQTVAIAPSDVFCSAARQTKQIRVYADGAWTLSSDSSWLSPLVASGSGDAVIGVVVSSNETGAVRTGALSLSGAGADATSVATFTQVEGATCGGTYYGLFIGVNDYSGKRLSSLYGCVPDARKMRERCLDSGLWQEGNVSILTNSLATKAAVRGGIAALADAALPGDTVLIYQSSHGDNSDTNLRDCLVCEYDADYSDAEMAADLSGFARGVRVIVVIDACCSGGMFKSASATAAPWTRRDFGASVRAKMAELRAGPRVRASARGTVSPHYATEQDVAFITAADYDQYSWDGAFGGEFTGALMAGWVSGAADADGDSLLDFHELYEYAAAIAVGYVSPVADRTQAQCYNEPLLLRTLAGAVTIPEPYEPGSAYYDDFRIWLLSNGMIGYYDMTNSDAVAHAALSVVPGGTETALYYYTVCGGMYATLAQDERILLALISVDAEGDPVVGWRPDLSSDGRRVYTVYGSPVIDDAIWTDVTSLSPAQIDAAGYRFFRVSVRLK